MKLFNYLLDDSYKKPLLGVDLTLINIVLHWPLLLTFLKDGEQLLNTFKGETIKAFV